MNTSHTRSQRIYDHRLRDLVQTVGDPNLVAELGVPRSTVQGWLRGRPATEPVFAGTYIGVSRLENPRSRNATSAREAEPFSGRVGPILVRGSASA